MTIVVDDLALLLTSNSIVAAPVSLVKGRLPEGPDSLVAITEYGGLPPVVTHDGGVRRYPRCQVIVRDPSPRVARQIAQDIYSLFLATRGWTDTALVVNGTQYEVIVPLQEPFPLSFDTIGRTSIACNYEARFSG